MFESFCLVAKQVAILFILMGIGAACNKAGLLKEEAVKGIVNLLLLIVTPCLIISAFQRDYNASMAAGLLQSLAYAFGFHLLAILLAHLFVHHPEKAGERVLRFAVVFSNAGFMAIPLEQAVLGMDGVFYGAAIIAVFNLIVWSYGLILMNGRVSDIRIRQLLVNPGIIGVLFGCALFLCSIRLPGVLTTVTRSMAGLNTPLAMIVIGYYLAEAKIGRLFTCPAAYVTIALRLIAVPLAVIAAIRVIGHTDRTVALSAVIAASAPVAAMTTMFASRFRQDTALSVGIVAVTTLLSILTMPLIVAWAQTLF
ncbi:MAG: AEC family transporter [Kiritimatiellae bacterium]|nr:AEC family transporter [Kiritimatiellia bacterium]